MASSKYNANNNFDLIRPPEGPNWPTVGGGGGSGSRIGGWNIFPTPPLSSVPVDCVTRSDDSRDWHLPGSSSFVTSTLAPCNNLCILRRIGFSWWILRAATEGSVSSLIAQLLCYLSNIPLFNVVAKSNTDRMASGVSSIIKSMFLTNGNYIINQLLTLNESNRIR